MAMSPHKLQLIRMCLHGIQKPLQLLIPNSKFRVLVPSSNIRMDLIKNTNIQYVREFYSNDLNNC